jgi:hypothetical protein
MIRTDRFSEGATIESGTRLYRITSPSFVSKKFLLNGKGSMMGEGRYHFINEPTSYSSDNVLLCIAEKLFHMNNAALKKLKNSSYGEFNGETSKKCILVVFKCKEINDLSNIRSKGALRKYNINPSTITHPDTIYRQLQTVSSNMRKNRKKGIISPSARHSEGLSVAFFGDCTSSILDIEHIFKLELTLVSEDLSTLARDTQKFNPKVHRVSQNIGYFEFNTPQVKQFFALIEPRMGGLSGFIDFYRFKYNTNPQPYPDCAIGNAGSLKGWI